MRGYTQEVHKMWILIDNRVVWIVQMPCQGVSTVVCVELATVFINYKLCAS